MPDPEIPERGYTTKDVAEVEAPKKKSFVRRHWGKLALTALVGIPTAVQFARSYAALAFTYSSGDRIGYVQKLSRKGWVCKTWEGELQISNIPGSAPVLFYFTVRSDSVAKAIQGAEGRQVALSFEQHPGIPLSCFGDTEYFISGVRVVNPQPGFPAASPATPSTPAVPVDSPPSAATPVPPVQK
ncbi:MAG: hypothetical protein U0164_13890 [Gemmatimonadaceae bacterium]